MGTLKTDNITARTGNAMNLGVSGDTVTVPSGATLSVPSGATINVAGTATGLVASADTIAVAKGGTGATSASAARTALGVALGSDVQAFDSDTAKTDVQQTFSKSQIASTYTGTGLTLDFDTYQNFIITLSSGANSLANPSTEASQVGQTGYMIFIQPSSGSAGTLTLGTDYESPAGGGIALTATNSKYDVVGYVVKADNSVLLLAPQADFS
tara:strand:+ start:508 stop:1143 length:636 start_codon:yes stop_codon:yes gene_type:complete